MKKLNCVLLVDDDEDDNYFHRLMLEESSLVNNIKIIESGLQALEFIRTSEILPELIFLDANMPKMSGWEFVQEYKKISHEQEKYPVIIMLTTSLNPADQEKAIKNSEIDGFETKPLTTETFHRILDRHFTAK